MKKRRVYFFIALAAIGVLGSCEENETQSPQGVVSVQFQASELVIAEDHDGKVITLQLSDKAIKNGELNVEVLSLNENFTIEPEPVDGVINLPVVKGGDFLSFTVIPNDNAVIDGDEVITFTLSSASEGIVIGDKKSLKITIADNEIPATANFLINSGSIRENSSAGAEVVVSFSGVVPGEGTLTLSLDSDLASYGTHFITEPAAVNGKVILPVQTGVNHVSFKLFPVDDKLFNGERNISLLIEQANGAVSKGQGNTHDLRITDDELSTKTKGYTIGGGGWTYSREYSYNEDGSLAVVAWEKNTPGFSSGTYEYFYDAQGKVVKVVDSPMHNNVYTWEGDHIVKEERFKEGVLVKYTLFGYDVAGNIGEVAVHYKQEDGSFPLSLLFVYLYHNDGNVYKRLAYSPIAGKDDYSLLSTYTFEHYLDVANPFSMVEILPNVHSQPQLPQTYRVEEGGKDILYQFTYEFDDQGRPTKRMAASTVGSEVAYYHYFD